MLWQGGRLALLCLPAEGQLLFWLESGRLKVNVLGQHRWTKGSFAGMWVYKKSLGFAVSVNLER